MAILLRHHFLLLLLITTFFAGSRSVKGAGLDDSVPAAISLTDAESAETTKEPEDYTDISILANNERGSTAEGQQENVQSSPKKTVKLAYKTAMSPVKRTTSYESNASDSDLLGFSPISVDYKAGFKTINVENELPHLEPSPDSAKSLKSTPNSSPTKSRRLNRSSPKNSNKNIKTSTSPNKSILNITPQSSSRPPSILPTIIESNIPSPNISPSKRSPKLVPNSPQSPASTASNFSLSSPSEDDLLLEHYKVILTHMQTLLLATAAVVFICILIYSIYYINLIRKIYAKDRVTK